MEKWNNAFSLEVASCPSRKVCVEGKKRGGGGKEVGVIHKVITDSNILLVYFMHESSNSLLNWS